MGTASTTGAVPEAVRLAEVGSREAPTAAASPETGVEALYGACKQRVEGPSASGECSTDADCVRTGCSQEVCVAASQGDVVTTCEILPCFQVLDACSCREGLCSWSLKVDVPPGRRLPGFGAPSDPVPASR